MTGAGQEAVTNGPVCSTQHSPQCLLSHIASAWLVTTRPSSRCVLGPSGLKLFVVRVGRESGDGRDGNNRGHRYNHRATQSFQTIQLRLQPDLTYAEGLGLCSICPGQIVVDAGQLLPNVGDGVIQKLLVHNWSSQRFGPTRKSLPTRRSIAFTDCIYGMTMRRVHEECNWTM